MRIFALMDESISQQIAIVDCDAKMGCLTTGDPRERLWEPEPIGHQNPIAWAKSALESYFEDQVRDVRIEIQKRHLNAPDRCAVCDEAWDGKEPAPLANCSCCGRWVCESCGPMTDDGLCPNCNREMPEFETPFNPNEIGISDADLAEAFD